MSHRFVPSPRTTVALLVGAALLAWSPQDRSADAAVRSGSVTGPPAPQGQQSERPIPPRPVEPPPPTDGEALLLLTPARQAVAVGDELRITIAVLGAEELVSFPATLRYDAATLRPVDVEAGKSWKGGGPPALLHAVPSPGSLVLGISRLGATGDGVGGVAELVEVRFEALAAGTAELSLERFALLGPGAARQSAKARTARVTVR